jgi:hypothetical protein
MFCTEIYRPYLNVRIMTKIWRDYGALHGPEGFAVIVIREVTGERKLKRSRRKSAKWVTPSEIKESSIYIEKWSIWYRIATLLDVQDVVIPLGRADSTIKYS